MRFWLEITIDAMIYFLAIIPLLLLLTLGFSCNQLNEAVGAVECAGGSWGTASS
jgi:hypothetical protein